MIKKIKTIKYVRGFIDFDASTIDFKRKTVIYAPHGTGKTSLSRLLERISDKKPTDDLLSQETDDVSLQEFSIVLKSGEVNKSNYTQESNYFLVFNSDYIDRVIRTKNFSDNDVSGYVVIPIGEDSNEISNIKGQIVVLEEERQKMVSLLPQKFTDFKTVQIEDKKYGNKDIKVWEWCNLEKLINEDFEITTPIKPDLYDNCEKSFKEISDLTDENKINNPKITKVPFQNINFSEITNELSEPKSFPVLDESIRTSINEITNSWIASNYLEKGIDKSIEDDECILCKRKLNQKANDLFERYKSYFANEESKFKNKLDAYTKSIETLKTSIEKKNNNLSEEINRLAGVLGVENRWLDIDTTIILKRIGELKGIIQDKKDDPSQILSISAIQNLGDLSDSTAELSNYDFSTELNALNEILDSNDELIKTINKKIDDTGKRKTELREEIGKKFLFDIYTDNKFLLDNIIEKNTKIRKLRLQLSIEEDKLPKKSVAKNIAKLATKFLNDYLYIKKYKIQEKDGAIQLHLNNKDISQSGQRISEGEKTMIALCYYFASSIQKLSSLAEFDQGVFIIDDPVNSTGYNYFFGVCNLIKNFHVAVRKDIWNEETDENKLNLQKIVLTHNTQFFNVLREHTYKKALYLNLKNKSLTALKPNQLKSEFENSLSNIKRVVVNDEDLNIGNDLRRFLETLRHFYGYEKFNAESVKRIFKNFSNHEHEVFYLVVNYYSHGNPETHTDPLSTNLEVFREQFKLLIESSDFKEKWDLIEID
jgi:wobble nucleotide-excising tRNase